MPAVVSAHADIDGLAAEYVLGTLDADERAHARTLLAENQAFAAKVKVWERWLGELHLMVEPVDPDPSLWERIKANLPQPPQPEPLPPPVEAAMPEEEASLELAQQAEAEGEEAKTERHPGMESLDGGVVEEPRASLAPAPTTEAVDEVVAPRTLVAPADVLPAIAPEVAPSRRSVPAPPGEVPMLRRRLTRWRAYAALLTLLVLATSALIAAWRFAPDRVPPILKPEQVMRRIGVAIALPPPPPPSRPVPPPRPQAPPESRFDE